MGPGYDARQGNRRHARSSPRRDGATYDAMWRGADQARAPTSSPITSYNEWHEGTQIEPARAAGEDYESYDGAWGLRGRAAEGAYLERTSYWVNRVAG